MNKWDIGPRRVVYTCNCGWIDTGHSDPTSYQPHIGADSLWSQMLKEEIPAGRDSYPMIPILGDKDRFRFPNGREGFVVTYRQQMEKEVFGVKAIGREQHTYVVSRGLTIEQKQSVALAIVQRVSQGFESIQAGFPARRWTNSGFSVEDLVSNLISFYRAVLGPSIERGKLPPVICGPCLGLEDNYRIYDRKYQNPADPVDHGKDWSQIKNYSFHPKLPAYVDPACRSQPCRFPRLLQIIQPARYGELFRAWELPYKHGYGAQPPFGFGRHCVGSTFGYHGRCRWRGDDHVRNRVHEGRRP